ncbi:amino acid transporter, putative, partial [Perkinsus marinus ATCC 50983]
LMVRMMTIHIEVTYRLSGTPMQLIAVFCTFLLSYNVSITVPTIIKDVQRPQRFPRVAWISFVLVASVYFVITIVGYLAFGDDISKFDTMVDAFTPKSKSDWTIYSWLINVSTIVLVSTHFLVLFSPTAQLSDTLLKCHDTNRWKSRIVGEVVRCCCRVALVALCVLIALLVPSVDKLVNLLSAVFVVLIALVYPTVYYWRILQLNDMSQSVWKLWLQRCLLVVAAVALIFGTYMAIKDLM